MSGGGIPVLDLAPFLAGDAAARDAAAAEMDRIGREIGFFLLRGHGVDPALTAAAAAAADAFFRLPEAEKRAIAQPAPEISRGYTPPGGEALSAGLGETAPGDLKEMIDIGPVDPPPAGHPAHRGAGHHFHPNLWPARPEGFRPAMEAYYRRMNRLADDLMRLFARALALPEDAFAASLDRNISALRLICYPEQTVPPVPGQLRSGAHTDYGTLTILTANRAAGGLQARHRDGRWIDVLPEPGEFVVNIGDAMEVWTNDRWVSTLHRVVNPPPDLAATARRLSLVFFHQPNHDALIEALPSCTGEGNPARHAPISFGDHWTAKWMATKTG